LDVALTDAEVGALVREKKHLPGNYRSRLQPRAKRGRKERQLDVTGADAGQYRIVVSQSDANPLAFSVILVYKMPGSNRLIRLRRYNGRGHQHTNQLERQTFYGCHVHIATERYQALGMREDAYAEPTSRFADLESAVRCLLEECGFEIPSDGPLSLFGGQQS